MHLLDYTVENKTKCWQLTDKLDTESVFSLRNQGMDLTGCSYLKTNSKLRCGCLYSTSTWWRPGAWLAFAICTAWIYSAHESKMSKFRS